MSTGSAAAQALLYLRVMSLAGRIKSRLKRLKQPKYLAGAVVGVAYLYFVFFDRVRAPHRGPRPGGVNGDLPAQMSVETLTVLAELGALLLLVVVIVNWVTPRRASLPFSEAEIAFLFPAPVSRRTLIHYRLLGAQLGIAVTSLILTVAFGRGRGFGGHYVFHAIGWWLVLATLNLHFTGTSFVYSRLLNRSLMSVRQKALRIAVALVIVAGLVGWALVTVHRPDPGDLANPRAFGGYLVEQLHVGPMPWLLAIPRLLIAPYTAGTLPDFFLALGPAVGILVAHYFWVVRTEVSFEEASIARAQKRAARGRAVEQGDWRGQNTRRKAQAQPFALGDSGPVVTAFLWKNLLSTSAFFRPRVALAVAALVLVGGSWLAGQPERESLRAFLLLLFGIQLGATVIFGPSLARQDLRSDLSNADILKTYPLRGWQVVLGEMLAPLAILSVLVWLCLLAVFMLMPAGPLFGLRPSTLPIVIFGLAVITPPFVALQLLVPNAATILFPAWVGPTESRAERGIEVMGQRLIFMTGQLLITTLGALPPAIIGVIVFVLGQWLLGFRVAAVLTIATVCALLTAEVWLGVRWLGERFEQFDLSAELRP